ncbi:MAG: Flagellin domain protein [Methanomicrobiales archaeon 53_19]|nr:MAG: Flagellin domain protein [Methanomicrobiales archaeon 53_19]
MRSKNIMNEKAVSPVVGVMLMLVVTIIIAAIVSGFTGGLVSEAGKSAQASIKADYSQNSGLTITHLGGDIINTLQTKIIVQVTADFGSATQKSWEVNTSVVKINGKPWFDKSDPYTSKMARTFQPGSTAVVIAEDLGQVQPQTYTSGTDDSTDKSCGFNHENAIGQRFILSLVDDAGRTIARTEVLIRP